MNDLHAELSFWQLIDEPQDTGWIADNIFSEGVVSSLVPQVFEAYARVLHPAFDIDAGLVRWGEISDAGLVRWGEISDALSRPLEPSTSFAALTGLPGPDYPEGPMLPGRTVPLWEAPPEQGTLDARSAAALASTLETCTNDCADWFFGLWAGYADIAPLRRSKPFRRSNYGLCLPDRDFLVFRGPSSTAARSTSPSLYQAMNLWWTHDCTFFVATDVDLVSTYVGGTARCIEALKNCPDLEVLPVTADTNTWD